MGPAEGTPSDSSQATTFWVDLLGSQVRFRDVNGFRTRSIESGDGEVVVLLHGLSGHAETWVRNLGSLGAGFTACAIDMLGHGLTAKPAVDYSIQVLAEHVLGLLDALGVERAHLVGQSLGGWVAGWTAANHPDRVASFVSVTGAGLQLDLDGAIAADAARKVGGATRKALDAPTRAKVRERLEWLMFDGGVVTDELVETRYRIYSQPDFLANSDRLVSAFAGDLDVRRAEMLDAHMLGRISCPSLVLWTRQNPTLPWQTGQRASEIIPGAQWYLMEDAGHWPQFEKAAEFNDVVGGFLRSVAEPDRTSADVGGR